MTGDQSWKSPGASVVFKYFNVIKHAWKTFKKILRSVMHSCTPGNLLTFAYIQNHVKNPLCV